MLTEKKNRSSAVFHQEFKMKMNPGYAKKAV